VRTAGTIATDAVAALKEQPAVLALVVLQFLVLAAVLYSSLHRQSAVDKQFDRVFELLQTCVKGD
jgi:hypothetical protein